MAVLELNSTPLISDANLVYYWREESNSAPTVGSNTGTETSVTHPAGKFGNGVHFNGSSAYVSFPTMPTGSSGSISLWLKYTGTSNETMFAVSNDTDSYQLAISHSSIIGNNIELRCEAGSNTNVLVWMTNTTTNDGNWHHFVVTTSGSGVKCYLDGSDVTAAGTYTSGNSATNFWFSNVTSAANFYIGAIRYNSTGPFLWYSGDLDDIAIFSRELSATEVNNLYTGNFTSIKTVNGLAKASIKTVNGLAIASVKTINGVS